MRYCYSITQAQLHLIEPLSSHRDTGFEIRLDTFTTSPNPKAIRAMTSRPLLATWRSKPHLGQADSASRAGRGWDLRRNCAQAGFELIDLELDEQNLDQQLQWCQEHNIKTVLSHHELTDNAGLDNAFTAAAAKPADIIKIIGTGCKTQDLADQRKRYEQFKDRNLVHFHMGGDFAATRVLSLVYGGPFTFLTPEPGKAVAPGQLTLQDVTQTFRPTQLSLKELALFAVIGTPIGHSKSPAFHSSLLRARKPNSLFLPLPAASAQDLQTLIQTFPELHGMACTKPMKEHAFQLADSFRDDNSHMLGAVNTLLRDQQNWAAANTDLLAMETILKAHPGVIRVIGYGGLGKAVVQAARAMGRPIQVSNRSPERLAALPDGVDMVPWSERARPGAAVFVQATAVGMEPNADASPLEQFPDSATTLIETIYNPRQTKLMTIAGNQGLQVIDGLALFNSQAQIQNQFFLDTL